METVRTGFTTENYSNGSFNHTQHRDSVTRRSHRLGLSLYRRVFRSKAFSWLAVTLMAISSMSLTCQERLEPRRPENVSPKAHWTRASAPRLTKGVWIHCAAAAPPRTEGHPSHSQPPILPATPSNRCKVWHGATGTLLVDEEFTVQVKARAATEEELLYVDFDGVYIELTEYLILEPVYSSAARRTLPSAL